MNVFNSLGSNFTLGSALRVLFSAGGGSARRKLIAYLEDRYQGRVILTYKGREALTIALNALALQHGTVAINGFTCWAVYEAIREADCGIHYLDISSASLNFTPETLQEAIDNDPSIKVVLIQNTLGIPCDLQRISAICKERKIVLVEDLAHSIGCRYAGAGFGPAEAGTVGDFVILSFSQDKIVDAVSGGALIVRNPLYRDIVTVPTKHVALAQQMKDRLYPLLTWMIRVTHRIGLGAVLHNLFRSLNILSRPLPDRGASAARGLPGWYCAIILRQYRNLESVARHRREIAEIYARTIDKSLLMTGDIALIPDSANLRFPVLTAGRDRLIEYLKDRNINVGDIWYDAPVGPKKYLHRTDYRGQCPHAEDVARTMLNLPTHANVSRQQAERIARFVNRWLETREEETYTVRTVADASVWETFLRSARPHSFLHSWKWGQHAELTGSKIFRVGVYRGETLVAIAHFTKVEARRGSFLLCPHGPLVQNGADECEVLRALVEYCTRIALDENCDFIRFCPLSAATGENREMYRHLGFRNAPIHMHPELSWILDITKPEDELLKEMRKTTRYLIKKMEKEGVEITQSSDPADMEKFWSVYEETVARQQFTPFSKEYLQTEFELFAKDDEAVLFFGSYQGKIVAAAIIIFYNGQAFYHHSGSIQAFDDINASYLLQWHVIREAKRRGCALYNFWGIAPDNKPRHAWTGLSRFKKGFGGFAEAYLHAQDKPLKTKYAINYVIETVRRIRRKL